MRYYCSVCKETISKNVYRYSKDKFGKALCLKHQKNNTKKEFAGRRYFCMVCKETISEKVYKYSTKNSRAPLCLNHQKTVTPQALKLSKALNEIGVNHKLEYDDGFKHVDIAIEWAKIFLELDGSQHAFNPKQMCSDDERDKYSLKAGFVTKRIPNVWVDKDVERLALSVATLANKRYREILENQKKVSVSGIIKTVIKTARNISEKLENFE